MGQYNPLRYRGYVYDQETGLYYLQTRYYNPEIGRFINADVLVSTGQGLLSNNMFAYCLNNPVLYIDITGCVPQAVTDKIVHDKVLEEICKKNKDLSMKKTYIFYNGKNRLGGWGFCDLYNTKTGEVWELKKNSNSRSCRTSSAIDQLNNYINGRLQNNIKLKLHKPDETTIEADKFTFTQGGYTYYVKYWYEGEGILRYDYYREKTQSRKEAEAVVALAAITVLAILAPYTAPATGSAWAWIFAVP